MKFKFDLKLTTFLVSLFIGLVLVILGANNKYCLGFGFIVIAFSLLLFVSYSDKKIGLSLVKIEEEIDEVEETDELEEEDKVYILKQLYLRQKKLKRNKKTTTIAFCVFAFCLAVLGVVGLF